MAEFVLHVPDIDELGKDYAFELSPAWIDAHLRDAALRADPQGGPGALAVHAQQNGSEYLVTGTLRAQLVTECGRCLADAKVPVDVPFAALYTRAAGAAVGGTAKGANDHHRTPRGSKAAAKALELSDTDDDDDLQREPFSGTIIALDDLVREHLVLEMPMQPLCSEQCQGIPVPQHLRPPEDTFGADGAVDPRLAPLQRLRDNVPPESASNDDVSPAGDEPERKSKRVQNKE
jgi:uncharacterized protein